MDRVVELVVLREDGSVTRTIPILVGEVAAHLVYLFEDRTIIDVKVVPLEKWSAEI
jgi:hypothetical protein